MRSLKYGVLALTPLLGAGGFAQGLNLGMNDGLVLQAQAATQAGSYGAMNGGARPEPDREPGADRAAATPVNGEAKPDVGAPRAGNLKSTPRAHAKARARKSEKKSQDTN
jgi:hypothetical protein